MRAQLGPQRPRPGCELVLDNRVLEGDPMPPPGDIGGGIG